MILSLIKTMSRRKRHETEYDEYIAEFVYGGIDGTITSFAVVAGATGANLGLSVILILGIGSLVADGLSMGVGSFFSKKAEVDLARKKHGDRMPENAHKSPVLVGLTTFGSFILIGVIPLVIYILTLFFEIDHLNLFAISSIGTGISLFSIGIFKSFVTQKNVIVGILETLFIGGLAAVVAYYIGFFLERIIL